MRLFKQHYQPNTSLSYLPAEITYNRYACGKKNKPQPKHLFFKQNQQRPAWVLFKKHFFFFLSKPEQDTHCRISVCHYLKNKLYIGSPWAQHVGAKKRLKQMAEVLNWINSSRSLWEMDSQHFFFFFLLVSSFSLRLKGREQWITAAVLKLNIKKTTTQKRDKKQLLMLIQSGTPDESSQVASIQLYLQGLFLNIYPVPVLDNI